MSDHGTPDSRYEPPSSRFSEDLTALSAIMAESFEGLDSGTFAEYVREIAAYEHSELILVRNPEGDLAGGATVLLTQEGGQRVGWIYDAAIAHSEQGQNQGDLLVGYAVDWASYRGANVVVLDPEPNLGTRHRPGEPRSFDPGNPRLVTLNISKAIEFGKQEGYRIEPS